MSDSQDQSTSSIKVVFSSGIQSDKKIIFSSVSGATACNYIGAVDGIAVWGQSAGILFISILFGGVYGGGRLGSQIGEGRISYFSC